MSVCIRSNIRTCKRDILHGCIRTQEFKYVVVRYRIGINIYRTECKAKRMISTVDCTAETKLCTDRRKASRYTACRKNGILAAKVVAEHVVTIGCHARIRRHYRLKFINRINNGSNEGYGNGNRRACKAFFNRYNDILLAVKALIVLQCVGNRKCRNVGTEVVFPKLDGSNCIARIRSDIDFVSICFQINILSIVKCYLSRCGSADGNTANLRCTVYRQTSRRINRRAVHCNTCK